MRFHAAALAALVFATQSAIAHDQQAETAPSGPLNLEQITALFGMDLEATEITHEEVADGLYVLFGAGGNIAVSHGEDGVLIVDDQFPQLMPKIKRTLKKIADDRVDVVINTHWHFDHAEGNLALGKEDTQIVSQANSRSMLMEDNLVDLVGVVYDQKAYPAHALPDVTYETAMSYHFNGEEVSLVHFGPAHTTGDTAVIFRGRNAVHMGDVFNNTGYPFIDAGNGGDIDGMIAFCEAVLAQINEEAIVIPGHGPVTDRAEFARYVDVLKATRAAIAAMIDDGKSLEEIMAAKPTAAFDEELGAGEQSVRTYVDRVVLSLTR